MNEQRKPLSRREFLMALGAITGGLTLAGVRKMLANARIQATSRTYLPFVARGGPTPTNTPRPTRTPSPTSAVTPSPTTSPVPTVPPPSRSGLVVHVRDANATAWTGSGHFYDYVDTATVEAMLFDALQELTGQSSWAAIWSVLFGRVHSGGYQPGQKIAIKTSFNNSIFGSNACGSHDNRIDAVPQLALALLNGLSAAGVQAGDVYFYDASGSESGQRYGKTIPNYFRNPLKNAYPQVHFIGQNDCSGVQAPTYGKDPSLTVTFNDPWGQIPDRLLTDILYDATYIINMPIVKAHKPAKPGSSVAIPASISMKNHYGSINYVYASSNRSSLHEYMEINGGQYYTSTYNPVVDVNKQPIIKNKTALLLADCLYGSTGSSDDAIKTWAIFGNQAANSILVSTDPVALDCVAVDLLRLELPHQGNRNLNDPRVYDFLFCAQEAGLGVCEGTRGNPGGDPLQTPYGSGYNDITYVRIDR
ncbi:MAG: hypothetical protein Fur0018_07700 [Anaerolineales bacterium]